jgi:hypothetical protein
MVARPGSARSLGGDVDARSDDTDACADGRPDGQDPALNRRERLAAILERDGAHCVWCRRAIDTDLVRATTEHVIPRLKGGPSWIENEVAACARCNRQRGHRTLAEWLDECEGRGWEPDAPAVVAALERLEHAIARRGGQRRARRYLDSQLRRLRNRR